jgi:GNAT superfamily N-acetyltransferase
MLHWYRLIGAGSAGARTLERDGVVAALVPAALERSVVNAVAYERPDALAAAYDEIAAAYAEIGAKWTVWVHDGDRATVELLARAGRVYVARLDGEAAGCCAATDEGENSEIQMVAVVPEARGRGLSGKLIAHALADAAGRGMRTSTLVATKLGLPVYERLGYRSLGVLEMWERRLQQG